jgi:hypothetical protein
VWKPAPRNESGQTNGNVAGSRQVTMALPWVRSNEIQDMPPMQVDEGYRMG